MFSHKCFTRLGLKEEEMGQIVRNDFDSGCLPEPNCREPDTYRTIDGSCNHRDELRNLGRAVTGYRRFLKPAYDDGKILLFLFISTVIYNKASNDTFSSINFIYR